MKPTERDMTDRYKLKNTGDDIHRPRIAEWLRFFTLILDPVLSAGNQIKAEIQCNFVGNRTFVIHVRQSFADLDRNRRRYFTRPRHSLRHRVKANSTASGYSDVPCLEQLSPRNVLSPGEFPLAWTRGQIGGRFTLWDRQTDPLARIAGHS